MADDNGSAFERWLNDIDAGSSIDGPDSGTLDPASRRWLEDYFEQEGPVSSDIVKAAATAHQLSLAREATAAVVADLRRTTPLRPEVVVDFWDGDRVRISINRGYRTPSMDTMDRAEAYAQVADYFQGELAQESGMWPTCDRHDTGAHPEVRDDSGVWWCRKGEHPIAPIGELAPD
ncbi:MAG: hypothetical protein MUE36_12245 [Acidimicrobiales bacterium]|nr:hypothetical protein [Acidimicrobiales bacterium]